MIRPDFSIIVDHCAEMDALIKENPFRLSCVWTNKRSLAWTKVCQQL